MFLNPERAQLQIIDDPILEPFSAKLYIKREDLLHPFISGNKWRKLKYNFIEAKSQGFKTILTFGGAYSNHISATAAAGKEFGFETIGIIRGEETLPLNPTLKFAISMGMKIIYWPRTEYRLKSTGDAIAPLKKQFGKFYLIPEGGTNSLAVKGAGEIVEDIEVELDFVCSSVGTGGTLAGLISSDAPHSYQVVGFSALKNKGFLEEEIIKLLRGNKRQWQLMNNYHFGGYAKFNHELIAFINTFKETHGIALDPIYTGKMMYGIFDLIKKGYFPNGSRIVAVHTGGLQGIEGFNERFGKIIL